MRGGSIRLAGVNAGCPPSIESIPAMSGGTDSATWPIGTRRQACSKATEDVDRKNKKSKDAIDGHSDKRRFKPTGSLSAMSMSL